jgi:hypothetical protein
MTLAASVNQGRLLPKGAAYNRTFFMGVTGLTLTVTRSKDGAAFGAIAGTVTEISSGWYKLALTSGDTDTEGDIAFHATDGGVNVEDWSDQVAAPVKLADAVAHGGTLGSSTATLALDHALFKSSTAEALRLETSANKNGLYAQGALGGMALVATGASGNGLYITGNGDAVLIESYGSYNAVRLHAIDVGGGSGAALDLTADANSGGAAMSVYSGAGDAIQISAAEGHALSLSSAGTGKHDVTLSGSGDIQGTLTGTVPANIKKVNDVTITGTGASGNEWGP